MKILFALCFSMVLCLSGTCQGGVSLHFFGQAPSKGHQPFMFAVSTTHQRPVGAATPAIPRQRASQLHWENFDAAVWPPSQQNSWPGVAQGGRLGDFLAALADFRSRRRWSQGGPSSGASTSGGSGQTGGGSDHSDDNPAGGPGPPGGPGVVPEPASGFLWCLAGVLLLAFTRRPPG